MASERAEKVAEELERTINNFGCREDMEHITGAMLNMHRTLNQSFMNHLVIPFVQEMAKRYSSGRYDARNEGACKMCREMWDAVKKVYDLPDDDFRLNLAMV